MAYSESLGLASSSCFCTTTVIQSFGEMGVGAKLKENESISLHFGCLASTELPFIPVIFKYCTVVPADTHEKGINIMADVIVALSNSLQEALFLIKLFEIIYIPSFVGNLLTAVRQ
jgi:hypothetical protein